VLLKDDEAFTKPREADIINKKTIADLYQIPVEDVLSIVYSAYHHTASKEKTIRLSPFVPHTLPAGFREYVYGEFAKL